MIIIQIAAFPADFANGQTTETLISLVERESCQPKDWDNKEALLPGTRFVHIPSVNVSCSATWLLFLHHKLLNLIPQLMSSPAQQSVPEPKDCYQTRQQTS